MEPSAYSATVGAVAAFLLGYALWRKKKGNGWAVAVIVTGCIVGQSPTLRQFLPGVVNIPVDWISVFATGQRASEGLVMGSYSAAAMGIAAAVIWLVWKDGSVKTWELWLLAIASMVFGASWFVTSWMPGALNTITGGFLEGQM